MSRLNGGSETRKEYELTNVAGGRAEIVHVRVEKEFDDHTATVQCGGVKWLHPASDPEPALYYILIPDVIPDGFQVPYDEGGKNISRVTGVAVAAWDMGGLDTAPAGWEVDVSTATTVTMLLCASDDANIFVLPPPGGFIKDRAWVIYGFTLDFVSIQ